MILMKEKKENSRKIVASEKYTIEALKNITLNQNKPKCNRSENEDKYSDILDNGNKDINYFKW
ncbi:MAG TPA: hypothetical protein DCG60_05170 [Tissierella sp.]|uniref:hypothetical protein n=1 Tax=Tissierella praeacuta TaxID=43131 RepID=UPI000EEF5C84|nr:hypothetical protein [Tissierella praeacuta]HAE92025.1 hypothetical protein [Tissierella sp.]